jgi:hypothetical protein
MAKRLFRQLQTVLRNLSPGEVRRQARRHFVTGLYAAHEEAYDRMRRFLLPPGLPEWKRRQAEVHILRVQRPSDFDRCDFGFSEEPLKGAPNFYQLDPAHPQPAIERFLDEQEDWWIPVARDFPAFREPVAARLIAGVARENASFAAAAAIPNIAGLLRVSWPVGEFASDTAVLTMNEIRLAFLLAAIAEAPVGFVQQRGQLAAIIGSALGWRALARQIVSRLPAGAGLVPKGLIAFGGTYLVGWGLKHYLLGGDTWTREEKRQQRGRARRRTGEVVTSIEKGRAARWRQPLRASLREGETVKHAAGR